MTTLRLDPESVTREQIAEWEELQRRAAGHQDWERLPHQYPPEGDWFGWILEAGRGSGKSLAANLALRDHLDGPPCISPTIPHRAAIIAPTIGDAVETAETDDGALVRMNPAATIRTQRGGTIVEWPNKSQVRLFGAHTRDDVKRLRAGGNRCWVHLEEFAAMRYLQEAWDQMHFGLRLGPRPKWVMTTTPAPLPDYIEIMKEMETRGDVIVTEGVSTDDNPYLAEATRRFLYERYDGTALGAQELHGKRIQEAEGALWRYVEFEATRLETVATTLEDGTVVAATDRMVVGVDPSGGATECGIVAAAVITEDCPCRADDTYYPHFAVIADRSGKLTASGWAHRTINTYTEFVADRVVAEKNFGGDMVETNVRNVDSIGLLAGCRASFDGAPPLASNFPRDPQTGPLFATKGAVGASSRQLVPCGVVAPNCPSASNAVSGRCAVRPGVDIRFGVGLLDDAYREPGGGPPTPSVLLPSPPGLRDAGHRVLLSVVYFLLVGWCGVLEAEVPPCMGEHLVASCRSRCLRCGCQLWCLAAFGQNLGSEQGGVCGGMWERSESGFGRPGLPLPTTSPTRECGRAVASRFDRCQWPVDEPARRWWYVSWVTSSARPATQDCRVGCGGARPCAAA